MLTLRLIVAAARFVEGVTMNVNWHLLRAFREQQLDEYLDREFQIFGSSGKSSLSIHF